MAGQRLADLIIVRKLGTGGAGSVYLALRGQLLQPVALKLLHAHATTQAGFGSRRFQREAQALARLRHPNIVGLLDFDTFEGRSYLVMEYVADGRTLGQAIRRRAIEPAVAEHILLQLGGAMEVMHAAGVVHRDLKPGNILLDPLPHDPWHIRVVDFGLAKLLDQGMTTMHAAGTLRYMAPEQLTRGKLGPWTDYFAVGMIAVRLLTGRHVFADRDQRRVLEQRRDPTLDPVDLLDLPLPPTVEAFLRGVLARDVRRRLADPVEFRRRVKAACAAMVDPRYQATVVRRSGPPPSPLPEAAPAGESTASLVEAASTIPVGRRSDPETVVEPSRRRAVLLGAVLLVAAFVGWGAMRMEMESTARPTDRAGPVTAAGPATPDPPPSRPARIGGGDPDDGVHAAARPDAGAETPVADASAPDAERDSGEADAESDAEPLASPDERADPPRATPRRRARRVNRQPPPSAPASPPPAAEGTGDLMERF